MAKFDGDKCPCCGEERELEYGNVYAENGEAWHTVTCLKCETYYTAYYKFCGVEDVEYGERW